RDEEAPSLSFAAFRAGFRPAASAPTVRARRACGRRPSCGMRVMVVDDDARIANFVAKGLREAGFAVDISASGPDALALARATPFDAAVVDVMLPGFDGLELIERLRAAGVRIPVLILSARRSVDDRIAGLRRGGDDYLTKPFSFSELLVRVQALLR